MNGGPKTRVSWDAEGGNRRGAAPDGVRVVLFRCEAESRTCAWEFEGSMEETGFEVQSGII